MNLKPFKINGYTIPTPTEYSWDCEDLSSEQTGRTLDGVMHKDVIATKDTYTCTWKRLSWADAAYLLTMVDGASSVSLTYADPRILNEWITHDFYVGKRSCKAKNLYDDQNTWGDITMQFIRI